MACGEQTAHREESAEGGVLTTFPQRPQLPCTAEQQTRYVQLAARFLSAHSPINPQDMLGARARAYLVESFDLFARKRNLFVRKFLLGVHPEVTELRDIRQHLLQPGAHAL